MVWYLIFNLTPSLSFWSNVTCLIWYSSKHRSMDHLPQLESHFNAHLQSLGQKLIWLSEAGQNEIELLWKIFMFLTQPGLCCQPTLLTVSCEPLSSSFSLPLCLHLWFFSYPVSTVLKDVIYFGVFKLYYFISEYFRLVYSLNFLYTCVLLTDVFLCWLLLT